MFFFRDGDECVIYLVFIRRFKVQVYWYGCLAFELVLQNRVFINIKVFVLVFLFSVICDDEKLDSLDVF